MRWAESSWPKSAQGKGWGDCSPWAKPRSVEMAEAGRGGGVGLGRLGKPTCARGEAAHERVLVPAPERDKDKAAAGLELRRRLEATTR